MADFAAVLRKTLEGLGDATPAMRERVYDKARSTIAAKLAALNPPPPAQVAERQRQALEDAIASVERSFAPVPAPAADPLDELESVFSSIDAQRQAPPPLRRPAPAPAPAAVPAPPAPRAAPAAPVPAARPTPAARPAPSAAAAATPAKPAAAPPRVQREPEPEWEPEAERPAEEPGLGRLGGRDAPDLHEPGQWTEPGAKRRGRIGGLVAAAVVLVLLGGGAYAIWDNRDGFQRLTGITLPGQDETQTAAEEVPADTTDAAQPETAAGTDAGEEEETAAEPAAAPATDDTAAAQAPAGAATAPKFTQRLDSAGAETDAGAAGGQPGVGEGTSVAQLSPPAAEGADATAPDAPAATPPAQQGTTPPAAGTAPALPVGQRAIFYEERTTAAPGSAETGSIVWSTVQESPGGDLPPEAAIRAEATIPGKDMQLRMTIRRNADRTLPASHIIEMIFLTPNATGPEAIDNVLRVSMKGTEQDPGSPLLGNAAKIADGYFLVALDDGKGQTAANLALLRQQDWIDIPVLYKSGRRALFTMEKGLPGEKVFNDVLSAWQQNTNG